MIGDCAQYGYSSRDQARKDTGYQLRDLRQDQRRGCGDKLSDSVYRCLHHRQKVIQQSAAVRPAKDRFKQIVNGFLQPWPSARNRDKYVLPCRLCRVRGTGDSGHGFLRGCAGDPHFGLNNVDRLIYVIQIIDIVPNPGYLCRVR